MTPNQKHLKVTAVGAAVAVAAALAHLGFNTNFFGAENLCDGIVSSEDAESAIEGFGKITSTNSSLVGGGDQAEIQCQVTRSTIIPGLPDAHVRITATQEDADFMLESNRWAGISRMSTFAGDAPGAVSGSEGWILLPQVCWPELKTESGGDGQVTIIDVGITGRSATEKELARLLTHSAQRVAEEKGCTDGTLSAPETLHMPTGERTSSASETCGLPGFTLPGGSTDRERFLETVQPTDSPLWSCELTLSDGSAPYMIFTATKDKTLLSALERSASRPSPDDADEMREENTTEAAVISECNGDEVYFGVKPRRGYWDGYGQGDTNARPTSPGSLLDSFASAMGKKLRCG